MAANKLCYVVQGFREDCAKLIARFERLETVRFEGFSEIWKDMKFSLVFAGRRSLIELIEFCEDTLIVAKEFFLPPLSFKERIGGLYLLYALYFKMPVKGPKIRAKMEDWQDIIEIRAEIGQAEHHDANYILSKLMSENAFVHCPLDRELGLEKSYRLKVPRLRNTYSVLSDIRELAGPNDLFDRVNTLSHYYRLNKASEMERASGNCRRNNHSCKYFELYDSHFGKKLLDRIAQLENSRKFTNLGNVGGITMKYDVRSNFRTFEIAKNDPIKRSQVSNPIRCRLGHGFDTDSSPSENEEFTNQPGRNNLSGSVFDKLSFPE